MTDTLIIAGLSASLGLAALGWVTGRLVDITGASSRLRLGVWTLAFLAPVALPLAMFAIAALDIASPFAVSFTAAVPNLPGELSAYPEQSPVTALVTPAASLDEAPSGPVPAQPLYRLWLLGLVLMGAVIQLLGLAGRLRKLASVVSTSTPLADETCATRLGLAPDRIRVGDSASPLLAGMVRPVILLPRPLVQALSSEQLGLICAHEVSHLKSRDHLRILAEEVLMAVYWFNPVLRVIRSRLSVSREEVCDAHVLSHAAEDTRRAYAQTLLTAMDLSGRAHPVAAFTGMRQRPAAVRLRAILRPSPHRPAAMAAGVCAGVFLTGTASVTALAFAGEPHVSSAFKAQPTTLASMAPLSAMGARDVVRPQDATVSFAASSDDRATVAQAGRPSSLVANATPGEAVQPGLQALTSALAEARGKRLELEAQQARLRSAPKETWPEIIKNTELRSLNEALLQADKQKAILSHMSVQSPEMATAMAKVYEQRNEKVRAQIVQVTAAIEQSVALDIRMAAAQEAALRQELKRLAG